MGKSENDEPGFSFTKLASADNYKKWAWEMQFSLESVYFWDHTLSDQENLKPVTMILKDENLNYNTKFERLEKQADKIIAWTKKNVKYNDYIGFIYLCHIQQEFQTVKIDWLAHNIWKWSKRGILFKIS